MKGSIEVFTRQMLYADKRALQTDLKVQLLEIREKELNLYTSNTLTIGMQSAFFAGFSSTALMTSKINTTRTVRSTPRPLCST